MAGYCRCFCKNFADGGLPLTNLLLARLTECQSVLESVKLLLASSLVLATLEMDANRAGAEAVRFHEDSWAVVLFATVEKEVLASYNSVSQLVVPPGYCEDVLLKQLLIVPFIVKTADIVAHTGKGNSGQNSQVAKGSRTGYD